MLTATYIIALLLITAALVGLMAIRPRPDSQAIRFVVCLSVLTPLLMEAVMAVAVVRGNFDLSYAAAGAAALPRQEIIHHRWLWTDLWGVKAIRIPLTLGLLVPSGINLVSLLLARREAGRRPDLSRTGTAAGAVFCVAGFILGIAAIAQERMFRGLHDAFNGPKESIPESLAAAYHGLSPGFHLAIILVSVLTAAVFIIRVRRSSHPPSPASGLTGSVAFLAVSGVIFLLTRPIADDTRRLLPRLFRGEETPSRAVSEIDSALFGAFKRRCGFEHAALPDPRIRLPESPANDDVPNCPSSSLETNITLTADVLEINGRPVTELTGGRFRSADLDASERLPGLLRLLRRYESSEKRYLLQADQGLSFGTVHAVIRTAAAAGFDRCRLATRLPRQLYFSRVDLDSIPIRAVPPPAPPPKAKRVMEAHNVLDVLTAALNRRPPTPTAEEAVFAEVRLKMPVDSNAGTVSVHLGKETSTLTLEGPLTSPTRETFTIPHAEGVPDTEAMASRIRPFKTSHPGTDRVRVSADATIRYSDVVTVIGVLGNRLFLSAELMVGPRNALL